MFAVIGLGNPGGKYEETRHNAGFWSLESLASELAPHSSYQSKGDADYIKTSISSKGSSSKGLLLIRPMSYMNLSGRASKPLLSFFKIPPENILVIHDELDLPAGRVHLKQSGSAGGHNGVSDIINSIGTNKFNRIRIGIGHPRSSEFSKSNKIKVEDWVLSKPGLDEKLLLEEAVSKSVKAVKVLIFEGLAAAQNQFNSTK